MCKGVGSREYVGGPEANHSLPGRFVVLAMATENRGRETDNGNGSEPRRPLRTQRNGMDYSVALTSSHLRGRSICIHPMRSHDRFLCGCCRPYNGDLPQRVQGIAKKRQGHLCPSRSLRLGASSEADG